MDVYTYYTRKFKQLENWVYSYCRGLRDLAKEVSTLVVSLLHRMVFK